MTVNVELLDRVLAQIEAHPDRWNQQFWRCNTGMCFAGWTAQLHGDAVWLYPEPREGAADYELGALLEPVSDDSEADVVIDDHGLDAIRVDDRARRLLGLSCEQTDDLFHWTNTLDDLRRIVADIKAGAS